MNETTYTTTVGHEYATWLASRTEGPASQDSSIHITDNGDGTVSFGEGTFGALALLPEHYDGVISTGEGAAVMWIEGDPYEVQAR